jgi:hypothetical protein
MFKSAFSTLNSLFGSKASAGEPSTTQSSLSSFPRFSDLPTEIRLKIWEFSLEERIIPVHMHGFTGDRNVASTLPDIHDAGSDEEADPPLETMYKAMALTSCIRSYPCKCSYYPPSSGHTEPLPGVLLASHESRDATLGKHLTYLEKEYDIRGIAVHETSMISFPPDEFPRKKTRRGVRINPSVDTILLRFNVASWQGMVNLHHFAAIAANEIPGIKKVVISLYIAMPPYQWWQKQRFQKWRNWGADGKWVSRKIVKFGNLREIVVVVEGKVYAKMLPDEWRERTLEIWRMELRGLRERWPVEWEGCMPELKFVTRFEDV